MSQHAPKPLTFAEEELELIKRTEASKFGIRISTLSPSNYLDGAGV